MTETSLLRTSAWSVSLCVPSRYIRHLLPLLAAPDLALKEVQWLQDYRHQLFASVFTQVKRQGMSGVTLWS